MCKLRQKRFKLQVQLICVSLVGSVRVIQKPQSQYLRAKSIVRDGGLKYGNTARTKEETRRL
jgi:hypothetical protein